MILLYSCIYTHAFCVSVHMADVNVYVIKCKLNVYYLPLKLEYILKAGKCLSKKLEVEFPTDSIILLFTKQAGKPLK